MSNTKELLQKIANLRQHLQEAQGLVREAGQAALVLLDRPPLRGDAVHLLGQQVARGARHDRALDGLTRQAAGLGQPLPPSVGAPSPVEGGGHPTNGGGGEGPGSGPRLTARAARLLHQGRDLLHRLRDLAENPLLQGESDGALPELYRQTAAMIDLTLRAAAALPHPPSAQGRLCEGLEAVLEVVAQRLGTLQTALELRRGENQRLESLAQWLHGLAQGELVTREPLLALAHDLWQEARQEAPLRFFHPPSTPHPPPSLLVACHALTVAQVLARLLRHDADWQARWPEAMVAALVHDVGMLQLPAAILAQPGPLADEQRRLLEGHPRAGADLLQEVSGIAVEAALGHHERVDGTGYPAGLRGSQQSAFVRLLALCDVYAALCCRRPYRAALDTRTALTETLLLADRDALDRTQAQKLLRLSFFPVGTVVELTAGAIGVVVAAQRGPSDTPDPARPVVALLADSDGQPVNAPGYLDLAEPANGGIARILTPAERCHLLGKRYPLLGNDEG